MNALLALDWPFSESIVERLGWTLVQSLWQLALVGLLAAVTIRALRQSSAAMRYGALVVAMAVSVLVPLATWMLQPVAAPDHSLNRGTVSESFNGTVPPMVNGKQSVDQQATIGDQRSPDPGLLSAGQESKPRPVALDGRDLQQAAPSWWSSIQAALRPWFAWIV